MIFLRAGIVPTLTNALAARRGMTVLAARRA
jgi:hypothetical protein